MLQSVCGNCAALPETVTGFSGAAGISWQIMHKKRGNESEYPPNPRQKEWHIVPDGLNYPL